MVNRWARGTKLIFNHIQWPVLRASVTPRTRLSYYLNAGVEGGCRDSFFDCFQLDGFDQDQTLMDFWQLKQKIHEILDYIEKDKLSDFSRLMAKKMKLYDAVQVQRVKYKSLSKEERLMVIHDLKKSLVTSRSLSVGLPSGEYSRLLLSLYRLHDVIKVLNQILAKAKVGAAEVEEIQSRIGEHKGSHFLIEEVMQEMKLLKDKIIEESDKGVVNG